MGLFDKITGKEAKEKAAAAEKEAAAKAEAAKAREEAYEKKMAEVKAQQQVKVAEAKAEAKAAEEKLAANEPYKLAVDGKWGPKSIKATQHVLGITEDGICGTETIKAI